MSQAMFSRSSYVGMMTTAGLRVVMPGDLSELLVPLVEPTQWRTPLSAATVLRARTCWFSRVSTAREESLYRGPLQWYQS